MRDAAVARPAAGPGAAADSARTRRLLFVLPIVPWPIRRNGISLRFAPVIEYLAQRYQLDLLVLADEDEPLPPGGVLEPCHALAFIKVPLRPLPRSLRRMSAGWRAVWPWGSPMDTARYVAARLERGRFERAVLGHLQENDYSVVVWATAYYLDVASRIRRRYSRVRFVVDVVDSPTLLCFRNASTDLLSRMITRNEARKWRRLERRISEAFDATIYVSSVDAQAVRRGPAARIHVVPNGIFHQDAVPLVSPAPATRTVGFLGNMAYPPNISAAVRLAQRIFPRILATLSDATLLIIGRDPAPEVRGLAAPRISVTGTVDNIWPYIARANVFVFPMVEGAGLQNKILEAMHAGVPVVTTAIAADGLGASNGEQLLIADTDAEIAAQALKLLCDARFSAALAERARAFVAREFSWPAILPRYEAIVAATAGSIN